MIVSQIISSIPGYKNCPTEAVKAALKARFNEIFQVKTWFAGLNKALERLPKNKNEILLVLDFPNIPLQNNLSENDIRGYVKRRKINGSTRGPDGQRSRDTFVSLKN
jgi:hypothetical protein